MTMLSSLVLVLMTIAITKADDVTEITKNCAMTTEAPFSHIMKYFGQGEPGTLLKIEDVSPEGKKFLGCLYKGLKLINEENKFDMAKFNHIAKAAQNDDTDEMDFDLSKVPVLDDTLVTDDDIAKFHVKIINMIKPAS